MTEILCRLNSRTFLASFYFATRCLWCNQRALVQPEGSAATRVLWCNQRTLVDESEIIRTRMDTIYQKMAAMHGTLCAIPPRNSNPYNNFCLTSDIVKQLYVAFPCLLRPSKLTLFKIFSHQNYLWFKLRTGNSCLTTNNFQHTCVVLRHILLLTELY
jgi:hypothetical protein